MPRLCGLPGATRKKRFRVTDPLCDGARAFLRQIVATDSRVMALQLPRNCVRFVRCRMSPSRRPVSELRVGYDKTRRLSVRPINVCIAFNCGHVPFPFHSRECCFVTAASAAQCCANTSMCQGGSCRAPVAQLLRRVHREVEKISEALGLGGGETHASAKCRDDLPFF